MTSINCEINLILTWSTDCVTSYPTGETNFAITDSKHYVLIVTLSIKYNSKITQQLKSDFNRTIYWKKYHSKVTIQEQKLYLDYLIDPSFQAVNRPLVLSF